MKNCSSIFGLVTVVVLITIACNVLSASPRAQEPSNPVLFDRTATIPGGGGSAEASFQVSAGQHIQILLSAANTAVQPYASLQYPDGTSVYNPPIDTAANGANQVEIVIDRTGQYTLTLFDGSNQGGTISVKVLVLK